MKSDPQNASFGRLRLHEKNYKVIFTKNVILKVRLTLNSKRIYTKLKEHLVRDLKLTRAKTISERLDGLKKNLCFEFAALFRSLIW